MCNPKYSDPMPERFRQPADPMIEVDHNRAFAVFKVACDTLDALWPRIEAHCAKRDAEIEAIDKEAARANKEMAERATEHYRKQNAEYDAAFAKWKKVPIWCRFKPAPEKPRYYDVQLPITSTWRPSYRRPLIQKFESEHATLRKWRDLFMAMNCPHRVPSHVAISMVSWDSGKRLAEIKAEIGEA